MSVLGIIILVAAVLFTFIFNGLIIKRNVAENAFSIVRGLIKHRSDLLADWIDQLPEEKQQLSEIQQIKQLAGEIMITPEKERAKLDYQLSGILKNVPQSLEMSVQISENETNLAAARDYYNQAAANLNNAINIQPGKLFSSIMHLKEHNLWLDE